MEHIYHAAVVGGGIAGYSAALSLKSLNIDCLWLGESLFGDKVTKSEYVRNYPAFLGNGVEFFEALQRQKEAEGVKFTKGRVNGIYRLGDRFDLMTDKETYSAFAVILCTGVDLKGTLGGEREWTGKGVSYCAVCDGAIYRGKRIAAVAASPAFAEEIEFLAGFAEKVYAFCPSVTAFEHKNIELCCDQPRSIEGNSHVSRLVCDEKTYDVDGVFLLRNAVPPDVLVGGAKTDGAHILVGRDLSTNIGGLFAAGDVTGLPYQYAKAAGEGLVAAHSAKKYLKEIAKI